MLFNIIITDIDEVLEEMPLKLADDTKLGGIANISEDRLKIQKDLDRLQHQALSHATERCCSVVREVGFCIK